MCACKETDVRESPNDSTLACGEGQGSRGETCYAKFDENPVSSLPERGVLNLDYNITDKCKKLFSFNNSVTTYVIHKPT
jgi:hypothetical protein